MNFPRFQFRYDHLQKPIHLVLGGGWVGLPSVPPVLESSHSSPVASPIGTPGQLQPEQGHCHFHCWSSKSFGERPLHGNILMEWQWPNQSMFELLENSKRFQSEVLESQICTCSSEASPPSSARIWKWTIKWTNSCGNESWAIKSESTVKHVKHNILKSLTHSIGFSFKP